MGTWESWEPGGLGSRGNLETLEDLGALGISAVLGGPGNLECLAVLGKNVVDDGRSEIKDVVQSGRHVHLVHQSPEGTKAHIVMHNVGHAHPAIGQ